MKAARGALARTSTADPVPVPAALRTAQLVLGGVEYLVLSYGEFFVNFQC